jgi:hypothetical protein
MSVLNQPGGFKSDVTRHMKRIMALQIEISYDALCDEDFQVCRSNSCQHSGQQI